MVRILKICFVDPDPIRTRAFLWAHLSGGLWSLLAKEYYPTGFLGVRIFRSRETPGMFALIGIWTSTESLEAARRSPTYPVLERFQRNLTISTIDCGAVRVPASKTEDGAGQVELTQACTAAPVTTPFTTPPKSVASMLCDSAHHARSWARFQLVEAFYEISNPALHHDHILQRRVP